MNLDDSAKGPINRFALLGRALFIALAVGIGGPLLISFFADLNLQVGSDLPWFVFLAAPMMLFAYWRLGRAQNELVEVRYAWLKAIFCALALTIVALLLMDSALLGQGKLSLPGDHGAAAPFLQNTISLTLLLSAAVFEELSFRGFLQLGCQTILGKVNSEILSSLLFIGMHFQRYGTPGEAIFVILLAITCGRMTSITQSPRYAVAIHAFANYAVAMVVLYGRSVSQ